VLIVSIYDNEMLLQRARDGGARAYLNKRSAPPVLLEAVRRVARGESFFENAPSDSPAPSTPLGRLSPREFEVFRLLAEGHTVVQIAQSLHISPKTAGVHQTRIMHKLDLENLAQLTRLAMRHGIVAP
jgi:two-component system invasion response regulator UvrY